MSVPPVPTCPRCRVPVNGQAHTCHRCGYLLGHRPGLSPPLPYQGPAAPAPQPDRWQSIKASMLNGFGGVLATGGVLITLIFTVLGFWGTHDARVNWGTVLACILALGMPPLIAGLSMLNGARKIRKRLELAHPQVVPSLPQDEVSRVEREIRELLQTLPASYADQQKRLGRETDDLVTQLREMEKRRGELNRMAELMPGPELDAQRAGVEARLAQEQDAFILNALRQQLEGIDGQLEARQSVEVSCARLNAAYDAATQTLRYLRAELQATSALASNRQGEALQSSLGNLQSLGEELARTRAASEEVIRLTER